MKRITNLFVLFLFAFLLMSSAVFAQQKVVTSEGKYVLGLLDSKRDAKSLALMEARKKAIEQAIVYLEGMPEVKASLLTNDQLGALAISITSVDIQSEDWRTSGEIVSVIIPIRAIIDTSNLKDKIVRIQEEDFTESIKETQNKLASIKKELERLKASQQKHDTAEKKEAIANEQKPSAEVKPELKPQAVIDTKDQTVNVQKPAVLPQADLEKKDQPVNTAAVAEPQATKQNQAPPEAKKAITSEDKQKYESVMKNLFALDCLEKGNLALSDHRWNDAQYAFSKAVELNPNLAEAYTGKTCALTNLNQPLEALQHVENALKLDPQSARNYGIKAAILKDLPGKIKQALASINEAIKLKPNNPKYYAIRGEVYSKMGNKSLAQKDYSAACNLGAKESCENIKPLKQKTEARKGKS